MTNLSCISVLYIISYTTLQDLFIRQTYKRDVWGTVRNLVGRMVYSNSIIRRGQVTFVTSTHTSHKDTHRRDLRLLYLTIIPIRDYSVTDAVSVDDFVFFNRRVQPLAYNNTTRHTLYNVYSVTTHAVRTVLKGRIRTILHVVVEFLAKHLSVVGEITVKRTR